MQFNLRTALEPADLLGEPLARGDRIVVLQGAANRDPARFDDPDELDLRRSDNTPLSFGWGIHHCIGAPLARMEGEIAFNALLARFAAIELTSDEAALAPQLHPPRPARPPGPRRQLTELGVRRRAVRPLPRPRVARPGRCLRARAAPT